MGTLPSLLRRFYFIFKEQRDKSKKDSPSQPAPAPASPFQTRLIPFPLPWFSSSSSSSPLVTACLNFLISVLSCEDNSVWRECFHRLQQSRGVERCNASVCLFKVQLYCTSPHNDSVLNIEHEFKIFLPVHQDIRKTGTWKKYNFTHESRTFETSFFTSL